MKDYYHKDCVKRAIWVILLHHPSKIINNQHYKNLIIKEFKKGNITEKMLLTILDKYYWAKSNGKRVYFGSQFGKPCIEDKKTSDSLRKNFDLLPLNISDFKTCNK